MTRSLKHKFFSFELGYFRNPSQLSLLVLISSELKIAIAAYEVTLTFIYFTRLLFKLITQCVVYIFILGIQMEILPLTSLHIGLMK